ncbi:MAG: YHS domain-containing (seleno)protein [Arenicella sp.]
MKSILSFFSLLLMSFSVFADEGPTYVGKNGFAIKGYDTVAYFTESKPVVGKEEFKTQWNHATWLFSSQENLDLFTANPEKYAPQYGGYCAFAAAKDSFAKIEPDQFTILNDKLYLNYNARINKKWTKNRDKFIISADKNWPGLLEEALDNVKGS